MVFILPIISVFIGVFIGGFIGQSIGVSIKIFQVIGGLSAFALAIVLIFYFFLADTSNIMGLRNSSSIPGML